MSWIGPRGLNKNCCPLCPSVRFELIAMSASGLANTCHSDPFAEFVKKKVPSPHGVTCQNIDESAIEVLVMSTTVPPGVDSLIDAEVVKQPFEPDPFVRKT